MKLTEEVHCSRAPSVTARFSLLPILVLAFSVSFAGHAGAACPDDLRQVSQPTFVFDRSLHALHEHPGWPADQMIDLVNGRVGVMGELVYSDSYVDGQLLANPAAGLSSLAYNDVTKSLYGSRNPKLEATSRYEYAHYHTADPASAVAFVTPAGIELRWRADYRYGGLVQDPPYGPLPLKSFAVYRSTGATEPGSFGNRVAVTEDATAFTWTDDGANLSVGVRYWYKIMSVLPDQQESEFSGHAVSTETYLNAVYDPNSLQRAFWVENIEYVPGTAVGGSLLYAVTVTLGAYVPQGTAPALAAQVKHPDDDVDDQTYNSFPLAAEPLGDDHFRYTGTGSGAGWSRNPDFRNGVACRFVENGTAIFAADQHFLSDPNNRISGQVWRDYVMSPWSHEWRGVWRGECTRAFGLSERSYDGVLGDNAGSGLFWDANVPPYDFNPADQTLGLQDLLADFTSWLHDPVRDKLFFINGLSESYCGPGWCVDGMLGEQFATRMDWAASKQYTADVMVSGDCWLNQYNKYWRLLENTDVPLVIPQANAPRWSPAGRRFALASALLLQRDHRVLIASDPMYLAPEDGDPVPPYYPEWQIDLGDPLGDSPELPDAAWNQDEGCTLTPENFREAIRYFEHGAVIVNYKELRYIAEYPNFYHTYTLPEPPGGAEYYRVRSDSLGLVEGGRFWTERVGETIDVTDGHAEILVYEPIASPTVAEYAFQPLYRSGGLVSVLAVQARAWDKGPLVVRVDARQIGEDACLELLDDGLHLDVAADDGIFTSPTTIDAAALSAGIYELPIHVREEVDLQHGLDGGYSTFGKLKVLVVDGIAAKYVNGSGDTNLGYEGQPYNSITLDYDQDGDLDMLISIQENTANTSYLYGQEFLTPNGVPRFQNQTLAAFPESRPLDGTRGVSTADIDNDEFPDLFTAHASSPRLYRNIQNPDPPPALPRKFEDISAANGIDVLADHSWYGVWGDYDGDGFVDLYVGRTEVVTTPQYEEFPLRDHLLRNDFGASGLFVDASDALGEEGGAPTLTCTAAWGDFNGDGKLDLFVGDRRPRLDVIDPVPPIPLWSRLYQNMGGGQLLSVYGWRVPERPQAWGVEGSAWADMDNDGDLDLVAATNTGARYLVNTSSFFAAAPSELVEPTRDVFSLDFDLSGTRDLLVLPAEPNRYPALLSNYVQPTGPVLTCVSGSVGLTDLAPAVGGFAADFNGDGDQEVFLGRLSQTDPFFFKNVKPDGTDPPAHHYVAVKLKGGGAGNNVSAIGAKVSVTSGPLQQLQVVDGGSGRGGQASGILTFGLGPLSGPVAATVSWPNGMSQNLSLNLDQLTVIEDPARDPHIQDATISASYQPYPGSGVVWLFTWKTTYPSVESLDRVEVKSTYDAQGAPPSVCQLGQEYTWLSEGVPGVSMQIVKESESLYRHELRWDRPCAAICTYWYRVYSSSQVAEVRGPSSGAYKKLSIGVCIDDDPDPEQ